MYLHFLFTSASLVVLLNMQYCHYLAALLFPMSAVSIGFMITIGNVS
jgi:hypothetical protein